MDVVHKRHLLAHCGPRFFSLLTAHFFNHVGFCYHKICMASFLFTDLVYKKKTFGVRVLTCSYQLILLMPLLQVYNLRKT